MRQNELEKGSAIPEQVTGQGMDTEERIVFVRDALGEGTAKVLRNECIEYLDAIAKALEAKDAQIELLCDNNEGLLKDIDTLIDEHEAKEAELNKVIELMAATIANKEKGHAYYLDCQDIILEHTKYARAIIKAEQEKK